MALRSHLGGSNILESSLCKSGNWTSIEQRPAICRGDHRTQSHFPKFCIQWRDTSYMRNESSAIHSEGSQSVTESPRASRCSWLVPVAWRIWVQWWYWYTSWAPSQGLNLESRGSTPKSLTLCFRTIIYDVYTPVYGRFACSRLKLCGIIFSHKNKL